MSGFGYPDTIHVLLESRSHKHNERLLIGEITQC